jgi:predicted DNA-binding transcriptional regulator AlpA
MGNGPAALKRAERREKLADTFGYAPRGMRMDRAAAYLDMSTSSFLRLVEQRRLPQGIMVGGMVIWDRLELDASFDNLKSTEPEPVNTMHTILGMKS